LGFAEDFLKYFQIYLVVVKIAIIFDLSKSKTMNISQLVKGAKVTVKEIAVITLGEDHQPIEKIIDEVNECGQIRFKGSKVFYNYLENNGNIEKFYMKKTFEVVK
jgi:fructose-1,6-bisphosphatase/sedoheptulose 1,7-bisphosphatase-like protein